MNIPHRLPQAAASALLCVCLTAGAEPLYRVTWLPQEMGVTDMNGAGHVVGYVFTPGGPRIATWSDDGMQIRPEFGSPAGMNNHDDFVATRSDGPPAMPVGAWAWIGRSWRSISAAAPGFGYVFARAINDQGWAVGELADSQSSSARLPFLYRNGDLRVLPTLGGSTGRANDIDKHGRITGQAALRNPDGSESRHAFVLDSATGRMPDLGTLANGDSEGLDINDRGQVVGIAGSRGFLYSGGRMVDVGTLGGTEAFALSINNHGVVAGRGWLQDNTPYGFLYFYGRMVNLDRLVALPPGWSVWVPLRINDAFQILAQLCSANGSNAVCRVARLDPVPVGRLGQDRLPARQQALAERLSEAGRRIIDRIGALAPRRAGS
jgi:probable HAF family extracellular repeat protein